MTVEIRTNYSSGHTPGTPGNLAVWPHPATTLLGHGRPWLNPSTGTYTVSPHQVRPLLDSRGSTETQCIAWLQIANADQNVNDDKSVSGGFKNSLGAAIVQEAWLSQSQKEAISWLCPSSGENQRGNPVPRFSPEERECLGFGMPPLLCLGTDSHTR